MGGCGALLRQARLLNRSPRDSIASSHSLTSHFCSHFPILLLPFLLHSPLPHLASDCLNLSPTLPQPSSIHQSSFNLLPLSISPALHCFHLHPSSSLLPIFSAFPHIASLYPFHQSFHHPTNTRMFCAPHFIISCQVIYFLIDYSLEHI